MVKKIEPEDFIALCKYLLYGTIDISTETIQALSEEKLERNSLIRNFPATIRTITFRTIINRIYYGVFHYAYKRATINRIL